MPLNWWFAPIEFAASCNGPVIRVLAVPVPHAPASADAVSQTLRGSVRATVAVARIGVDGGRPVLSHSRLRMLPLTYFLGAAWEPRPSVVQPSPKYELLEQMHAPPAWQVAPMSLPSTSGVASGPSEAFSSTPLLRQSAWVRQPLSKVMSYIMPFCLKTSGRGRVLPAGWYTHAVPTASFTSVQVAAVPSLTTPSHSSDEVAQPAAMQQSSAMPGANVTSWWNALVTEESLPGSPASEVA